MANDFDIMGKVVIDNSGTASIENLKGSLGNLSGGFTAASVAVGNLAADIVKEIGTLALEAIKKTTEAVIDFGKSCVEEAGKGALAQAQLAAVLQSTGDASGMTAEQITNYASAMSMATMFTKDEILSAENVELTFTNIGKNVFPQATDAILNVAQAMGEDLQSATVQVGKALEDPITGMTALHRIGVMFTDTQKNQIKYFENTNQLANAQAIIIKELNKEFGSSAVAAGQTLPGQLDILHHKFDALKEELGNVLLPTLTLFVSHLNTDLFDRLFELADAFTDWGNSLSADGFTHLELIDQGITDFFKAIDPLSKGQLSVGLYDIAGAFDKIATSLGMSLPARQQVEGWITGLPGEIDAAKKKLDDFAAGWNGFWGNVQTSVAGIKGVTDILTQANDTGAKRYQDQQPAQTQHDAGMTDAGKQIASSGTATQQALKTAGDGISAFLKQSLLSWQGILSNPEWHHMWATVLDPAAAITNIKVQFSVMTETAKIKLGEFGDAVKNNPALKSVTTFVQNAAIEFDKLKVGIPTAFTNAITAVNTWFKNLGNALKPLTDTISQPFKDAWNNVITFSANYLKNLESEITNLIGEFNTIGGQVMQGLWDGMKAVWADIIAWAHSVAGDIAKIFAAAHAISSPSKVMYDMGANIMLGLANGLKDGLKMPLNVMIKGAPILQMATAGAVGNAVYNNSRSTSTQYGSFINYGIINSGQGAPGQTTTQKMLDTFRKVQVA